VLTATLTPDTAQDHTANGMVTFSSGGSILGANVVANGVAMLNTSLLPVGMDSIVAAYSDDPDFANSNASATEIVNGFVTSTVLTVSPNPAVIGQPVTLTAAVAGVGSSTIAAGTVAFYDGTTLLGPGTLDATGHAGYTATGLAIGTHTLSAVYAANAGFYGSTSATVALVVNARPSATTLAATPNPAGAGQTVALTAAVAGAGATPRGTVTFYDGAKALGPATLDATGHAGFTTSALTLGVHSLSATYAGSALYAPSTSAAVSEVIQTPGFTIALASPGLTVETYQHITTSVTLTSLGDFADNIALSCANPPAYVTCIFTPGSAALGANGSAGVSFYLDTDSVLGGDASNGPAPQPRGPRTPFGVALLFAPACLLAALRRLRRGRPAGGRLGGRGPLFLLLLPASVVFSMTLLLGGCGSNLIYPVLSAAPGTYVISITATGAATHMSQRAQLTLTVTP
jgi:hypothetical protein